MLTDKGHAHEKHDKHKLTIGDKITFAHGKKGTVVNVDGDFCCVDETAGELIESLPANHFENEGGSFREWVAIKDLKPV